MSGLRKLLTRWPVWIAVVAFASVALNVSIGVGYGTPKPGVHDEFAYLLMGDTFARGRLTNPTHPMWPHFETYHVFHRPSYQAKYPPAQGMFLALGQAVWGLPIAGAWISLALLCAATCWMLGAIVPRPWAFLGGMLLAANPHVIGWWGQSYWGGAVAALGGALLFGALFRLQERLRARDSIVMALGLALLANSRPFEGAMVSLTALPLFVLAIWRVRRVRRIQRIQRTRRPGESGSPGDRLLQACLVPLGGCLLLVAAWMLYYNYRITGDAFSLPYLNWHPEFSPVESIRGYKGPTHLPAWYRLERLGSFFMAPPVLLASLLGVWAVVKDLRTRFCFIASLLVLGVSLRFTDSFPHYLAPITCLISAVIVQGLRSLWQVRLRGRAVGAVFVGLILAVAFSWDALYLRQMLQDGPLRGALPSPRHWDAAFEAPAMMRAEMIQQLEAQPRKDLVLVQYESQRYVDRFEWVYNGPDIDGAEVVWARKLGEREDRELLAHFKDRQIWLLDPETRPLRLRKMR